MRSAIRTVVQLCLLAVGTAAPHANAAEPAAVPTYNPAAAQLSQYFYVDFPRALAAAEAEIALAEQVVAVEQARVIGYQPFRSFRQYGATYFAERSARVNLLAAQQRLECARQNRDALWRERQLVAAALLR
jgi:hypothetical protein